MKILIINFEYPPLGGGGGVATKHLAEELARRHEVCVITSKHKGLVAREKIHGVTIMRVPIYPRRELATATILSMISFVPTALWRGYFFIRQHRPDVLNAQFALPSGLPAAWLARWYRLPFVLSFVGGDLYDPTKGSSPHHHLFLRLLVRHVAAAATICTAISYDTKTRATRLHGVTNKIVVTHLGLVPNPGVARTQLALSVSPEEKSFVSIGRLIPRKGYDELLQAWQQVGDAHLYIVGQGPLREQLQAQAQRLNIDRRVHFLGFVSEDRKRQILGEVFGYVSAARHEGFGIVYLEAMQAGLPIVTTDDGGQTDYLKSKHNALLVPTGDIVALAQAVNWLRQNPNEAKAMGARNKEAVKEFYIQKTVARFEWVLQQAVPSKQLAASL